MTRFRAHNSIMLRVAWDIFRCLGHLRSPAVKASPVSLRVHHCLLQEADVPVHELDWIVCNGGADIWHQLPSRNGKDATWVADEQWEGHIGFR